MLERTVINWDTSYLEGCLLSLVNNTGYGEHTTVSFPVTHTRVVVHSPDKFNRFFSSVTNVFTGTKKYEFVKSIWPYADVPRGEVGRKCAVQEEEMWFNDWKDAIRHAFLDGRRGLVMEEDRLDLDGTQAGGAGLTAFGLGRYSRCMILEYLGCGEALY